MKNKKRSLCCYFLVLLIFTQNIYGKDIVTALDNTSTVVMRVYPVVAPFVMAGKMIVSACVAGACLFSAYKNNKRRKASEREARFFKNGNKENKSDGCFELQNSVQDTHCCFVKNEDLAKYVGCRIIVPSTENEYGVAPGFTAADSNNKNNSHVFPVIENTAPIISMQQAHGEVEVENKQYPGPWYERTEDWVKEHPFGQKIEKNLVRTKCTNQGKRVFKVAEKIKEVCDGFKKGDYVVVDALHKDHLEVFNDYGEWVGAANFDGTKNIKKTECGNKGKKKPLSL
jgi:hypothetical protein